MANIEFSLSNKAREDGKHQLLARVSSGRSVRFRIKSGVFISPDYWSASAQSVVVPIKRSINGAKVKEAQKEMAALQCFVSDLNAIIAAADDAKTNLTKDWVEDAVRIKPILIDGANAFLPDSAGRIFTADNIRRALAIEEAAKSSNEPQNETTSKWLFDIAPLYCDRNGISAARAKSYYTLAYQIGRYEMFVRLTEPKRKSFRMDCDTISVDDIEAFRDYIRNEHALIVEYPAIFEKILDKYPIRKNQSNRTTIHPRAENTIIGEMKRLHAIMNWCYKTGRTRSRVFDSITIGSELYGTPIYITREERNQIADYDLSGQSATIQQQRDIFVFQCLVGCRVGDLYSLTSANIKDGILRYTPSKTEAESGVTATVPLSDRALAIIDKYKGVDTKGRLFPFITEQNYNYCIKEIFHLCGVEREVVMLDPSTRQRKVVSIADIASSHMARRTFVGAVYAQVQDPSLIGKMSGHTEGSRAFARYRAIDTDMLKNVISKIE